MQRHLLLGTGTNITADGIQVNTTIPNPVTLWGAGLAFRQPLLAPKAWYDAETAAQQQKVSLLQVQDVERRVLAGVAQTILSAVTAERLAEISRVSLASSLSTLELTRRRARLGAGSAMDVLRAEQEVSLNRAQVISGKEAVLQSREALGMALGHSEPWSVTPDVRLEALAADAVRVCGAVGGVEQRADIRAAQQDLRVSQRRISSSDWLLAPTVDLVSDLSYTTRPFTANGRPTQWTVGALLSVPLYDGGIRGAAEAGARAESTLAELRLIQARRAAKVEIRQAQRAVSVAQQNFEVSRRSEAIAQETARLARLSFLNGKASSFELVDATRRNQQAQLDVAVKEFEVVRARILAHLARANCSLH